MKQKELAKKLDVSAQYLGKVLHGQSNFQMQTLEKIASVLSMSLTEFLEDVCDRIRQTEFILNMDVEPVVIKLPSRTYTPKAPKRKLTSSRRLKASNYRYTKSNHHGIEN